MRLLIVLVSLSLTACSHLGAKPWDRDLLDLFRN